MHQEYQYLNLIEKVLNEGKRHKNRTGIATKRLICETMKFDLSEEFPLLTTKKVHWHSVLYELLWFLSGSTNIQYLKDNNVHIWDANAEDYFNKIKKERTEKRTLGYNWQDGIKEGDLGPVYGHQWRWFNGGFGSNEEGVDQIKWAQKEIKNNPDSRRIIVSAWNPSQMDMMALPPCHCLFKFTVDEDKLHCTLFIRSNDLGLGSPFNIASYALLTCMFASVSNLKPGNLNYVADDCHIYEDHIIPLKEQLKRKPYPFPKLKLNSNIKSVLDFRSDDIELIDYKSHPSIQMKMSV